MNPAELQPFKRLVADSSGLVFDGSSEVSLVAALRKRMLQVCSQSLSAYLARLRSDEHEHQELLSLLTINETYFFREPQQLAYLVDTLVPRLLARRTDARPLRILSAGCSSGEEPYSIAIALREKFGEGCSRLVSIVAADVDQKVLARARAAQYGYLSFRAIPPEIHARYFVDVGKRSYRLCPEIQALVDFQPLNLLQTPYPAGLADFDVVLFRNVSLYFDRAGRQAIQQNLKAVMHDGGVLILGAAETLANDLGVFRLYQEQGLFYFIKGGAVPSCPAVAPRSPAPVPKTVTPVRRPVAAAIQPPSVRAPLSPPAPAAVSAAEKKPLAPPVDWSRLLASVRLELREKNFDAALALAADAARSFPAEMRFGLLEAYVHLQMRQFARAQALSEQLLARDGWQAEVYMLLGLLAKWQNNSAEAIRCFKMLVYCQPDCWPAHYHLATLLQADDEASAKRAYATALRQLIARPDADGGLLLPLDLPLTDIRFLCERQTRAAAGAPLMRGGGRHGS
jgi:chemotaxis protein methyltransferase CheR